MWSVSWNFFLRYLRIDSSFSQKLLKYSREQSRNRRDSSGNLNFQIAFGFHLLIFLFSGPLFYLLVRFLFHFSEILISYENVERNFLAAVRFAVRVMVISLQFRISKNSKLLPSYFEFSPVDLSAKPLFHFSANLRFYKNMKISWLRFTTSFHGNIVIISHLEESELPNYLQFFTCRISL